MVKNEKMTTSFFASYHDTAAPQSASVIISGTKYDLELTTGTKGIAL